MYKPEQKILENYAKLMVHYALNHGKDIVPGKTVWLRGGEATKPLYAAIYKELIKSGLHVIHGYMMDDPEYNLERIFYEHAQEHQIGKFEREYLKGMINEIDYYLYILSENNPQGLSGIDSAKIAKHESRMAPWFKWREEKELTGEFSWTICSYGTEALAKESGTTIEEYWNQIIDACYLEETDVVSKWKQIGSQIQHQAKCLNDMEITEVHITGPDINLYVGMHEKAAWRGGSGANIPSFETWISPDWRKTNGWIRCDNPWYCDGNKISGVYLEFKDGIVVNAKADVNDEFLQQFLKIKNANRIGEFSITDKDLSKIFLPTADTLYLENHGGEYGNMHIALGMAYSNCYKGDPAALTEKDINELGFNQSDTHQDIVLTTEHTVIITDSLQTENIGKIIKKDGNVIL